MTVPSKLDLRFVLLGALLALATPAPADEASTIYTTPKGTYRLEIFDEKPQIVVSTKGGAERAPLPGVSWEDPTECTQVFDASPDEQWIFRTESWRHHAVQGRAIYHRERAASFTPYKGHNWLTEAAQAFAIRTGGFKHSDFYTQRGPKVFEDHFVATSRGWSSDSARLLVSIVATGDFREDMAKRFYVYFNTRTKAFELSPYLRALNRLVRT